MNVVDSSAWLEYFADGPNATFFARPIEAVEKLVVAPTAHPSTRRARPTPPPNPTGPPDSAAIPDGQTAPPLTSPRPTDGR